ncbi:Pentatricopeptide repeat-containing protein At3g18970 [Linum grandiflorum]
MRELSRFRCLSLLNTKLSSSHQASQILAQLITNRLTSPSLLARLLQQYCVSASDTRQAHSILATFHYPNLFLFNTLLRCTHPKDSMRLFTTWISKDELVIDELTYLYVLGSCVRSPSSSSLCLGRQIQGRALKHGFLSNMVVSTTLIHFYGETRDVASARKVFDEMPEKSVVTWNAMVTGYCSQREKEKAIDYAYDALALFKDMLVGETVQKPNDTTVVCVLSSCSQLGMLEVGACIHGYLEKTICMLEMDVYIGTGLVDLYSKCGCLDSGLQVFNVMRVKNVLTWTAMATGLAIHGKGKEAMEVFEAMAGSGVQPNLVTFTSLLSACCHAGLVEEGLCLFEMMQVKWRLQPGLQHYGCIVDLLGKAGYLREAYRFIKGMPVAADGVLWRSLLSSSIVHGDVELGEEIGKILLQLHQETRNSSDDYVALSNVYASAERWKEVEKVRSVMKVKSIAVNRPGSSFVQSNHQLQ